jgi:hypothetical protein
MQKMWYTHTHTPWAIILPSKKEVMLYEQKSRGVLYPVKDAHLRVVVFPLVNNGSWENNVVMVGDGDGLLGGCHYTCS